jgi:UDP-N-acetylglucosamine 2-epimerase (non-hydrolysing)
MTTDPSPGTEPTAVVFGTRPEIIKLASVVRRLGEGAWPIDTGQHFDERLNQQFVAELRLASPAVVLGVGGRSRGSQIGTATDLLDQLFSARRPRAVVVQGDTNSALAGALAANAGEIPLFHVEAGLRSFDRRMPEEHNRVLIDHLADLCLAPTETARRNLLAEGIPAGRIIVTGNTVVDAVLELLPAPRERAAVLDHYALRSNDFVLSTFHRPENVDDPERLSSILHDLETLRVPVLLPMHPRTKLRVMELGQFGRRTGPDNVRVIDPIGYREFLALSAECALLVSDSGGTQEEATILKRPVVVVRRSTERPEALGTFCHLAAPGPELIHTVDGLLADIGRVHTLLARLPSPYGRGDAAQRCVEGIERWLSASRPPMAVCT